MDGNNIWFTKLNFKVSKLDANTGAVVACYAVGGLPNSVICDGINTWVANKADGTVSTLLAATGYGHGRSGREPAGKCVLPCGGPGDTKRRSEPTTDNLLHCGGPQHQQRAFHCGSDF